MITFSNVSKTFLNGTQGLSEVSFDLDTGEMILLTGPSGSGKTTLMKILTREYPQTEGEVIFNKVPLSQVKPSKLHLLRRKIGVVFQDYKLLPELNAWENISLPLSIVGQDDEEISSRVGDLLKLVGLSDKAELFPSELSGGEAQRIGIARALATAPKLLFADEPTGNLDSETTKDIISLINKINELGTTVILATHDLLVLDLLKSKRLIKLDKGRLVKDTGSKTPVAKKTTLSKRKPKESQTKPSLEKKSPSPTKKVEKGKETKETTEAKSAKPTTEGSARGTTEGSAGSATKGSAHGAVGKNTKSSDRAKFSLPKFMKNIPFIKKEEEK